MKDHPYIWLAGLVIFLGCWAYNSCDLTDHRKEQCETRKCIGTLKAKWFNTRYSTECLCVQLPE